MVVALVVAASVASLPFIGCSSSSGATASDAGAPPPDGATYDGGGSGDAGSGGDAGCTAKPPGAVGVVAPAPVDAGVGRYGQMTSMVLDDQGSPMLAWSSRDVGQVYFMRWDACAAAWTTPVAVDTVDIPNTFVDDNQPLRQVALARDAATGALALAYTKVFPDGANPGQAAWVAKSIDGGKTWNKEQVSEHPGDQAGDLHGVANPNVVFAGGKLAVAYYQDYVHCDATFGGAAPRCDGWYVTGDLGSWSRQVIPRGTNGAIADKPIGLAVDTKGKVAVAFLTSPDTGYDRVASFWRPDGAAPPIAVFDSNDVQNDDPSISLAFFGDAPRIAAHLVRDAGSVDYDLLFSRSDDGATWSAPVKIPRDMTVSTADWQSLAVDAKGDLAIAAYASGSGGSAACGWPKIARSTDGVGWATCGATPAGFDETSFGGRYVSAAYGPDGKLQLAWYNPSADAMFPEGVMYWHE